MDAISGAVPAPRDWPSGCRFADRCTFATDRCRTTPVALTLLRPGVSQQHPTAGIQRSGMARCVRVEEVAKAASTGSATQNTSANERSIA